MTSCLGCDVASESGIRVLKIVLIGNSGVGKSNLMARFVRNEFSERSLSTIGIEFATKEIKIGDRTIRVQLWDTAGQERYRAITASYYRGAHGALLVFDVTNRSSFEDAALWLRELREFTDREKPFVMLIGNKADLTHLRTVSTVEATEFAKEHGLGYIEVSALDTQNVESTFMKVAEIAHSIVYPVITRVPGYLAVGYSTRPSRFQRTFCCQ